MERGKDTRGRKRNKSYYVQSSRKRVKLNRLAAGMRGFLVTCNRDERQAVREVYNVLSEYADTLYGAEVEQPDSRITACDDNSDNNSDNSDDDMEKAMRKEVKVIQESQTKPKRFQNCFTNAKNCIFISTELDNPTDLAHKIFSDLAVKKTQKTRFAMRMLPVSGTCKAYVEDMKKLAEQILSPHFSIPVGESKSYGIVFRVRNNNTISRQVVVPMIGQLINDMNPLNRVHLDNPDLVVLVEIICGVCCMSVVKDFYKFRKYNFHEVIKDSPIVKEESETQAKNLETIVEETPMQIGDSEKIDDKISDDVADSKHIEEKTPIQIGDSDNIDNQTSKDVGDSKHIDDETSEEYLKGKVERNPEQIGDVGNIEENSSKDVERSKSIVEKCSKEIVQSENFESIEEKSEVKVKDSITAEEKLSHGEDCINKTVQDSDSKNGTTGSSEKCESTNV